MLSYCTWAFLVTRSSYWYQDIYSCDLDHLWNWPLLGAFVFHKHILFTIQNCNKELFMIYSCNWFDEWYWGPGWYSESYCCKLTGNSGWCRNIRWTDFKRRTRHKSVINTLSSVHMFIQFVALTQYLHDNIGKNIVRSW